MKKVVFYRTEQREVVLDFIRELPAADRAVIGHDLKVVQLGFPIGLPVCKSISSGLWEVRSSLQSGREARLIFFHDSLRGILVVVHGFIKKSRKLPSAELKLALKRKGEFQKKE